MAQKPLVTTAFILVLMGFALVFSASPAIEKTSTHYLHQSLKKATLSFASARLINALVSVAQEVRTGGSVKLFGTGGEVGVAPLAWLDPLNDLVERFSLIMLASCISLGIQIFLNEALPKLSLVVLLPISGAILLLSLLLTAAGQSAGRHLYRAGSKLLMTTTLLLVMIPTMAALNHLSYNLFLSDTYEAAAISLHEDTQDLSAAALPENGHTMDTLAEWKAKMGRLKLKVNNIIENIVDLIVVFIIQTMVLPLIMLWVFARLIIALLGRKDPLPFENYFLSSKKSAATPA